MCDAVHIDPATGKHTILGVFSNIKGRLTAGKFNMCFDLGSRDCTARNFDVDGNAVIGSCFLVHNSEGCDLYDCIGTNVGGSGTPTVTSFGCRLR